VAVLLLQVLHFLHWGQDRAEYKCSFKSSSGSAGAAGGAAGSSTDFDAPASVVAPPAGPTGTDIGVAVGFEPCALGEAVRDTLVLTSATSGVYEVPLMGQCVPPKPQGPVDISKVSRRGLGARHICMYMFAVTVIVSSLSCDRSWRQEMQSART
jgi:hydrocephalus-inducing protein